jgi:hypothetical protein
VDYTIYQCNNPVGKFESAGRALLARCITRDLLEQQQYITTGYCKRWIVKVSINGFILGSNGWFSSRDEAVHAYSVAKEELKKMIHVASDVVALQAFLDQVFSNVVGPNYWAIGHR